MLQTRQGQSVYATRLRALAQVAAVTLALALSASIARGDEGVAPSAGGAGVQGEGEVGAAPDPLTGAFRWTYQFKLPAARGVSRSLGLSYSSNGGDGEGGYGWTLAIPSIERAPLSAWPEYIDDGTLEHEDRYAFQGAPLVFVCVVGGADCNQPSLGVLPSWAAGWRHYRLQDDQTFSRFFLAPDRLTWRVQLKGGETWELGRPIARADLGTNDGVDYEADTPSASPKAHRWNLVRQYDLHDLGGGPANLVAYRWLNLGVSGRTYLADIWDTPLASSAGSATLAEFAHHVQLTWSTAPAYTTHYAHINRARPDLVLTHVGISAAPWGAPGYPREVVRAYHLRYRNPRSVGFYDPVQQSPLWGHEFLKEIQEETRCGTTESLGVIPDAQQCGTLAPTRFGYESGALQGGYIAPAPMPGRVGAVLPNYQRSMLVDLNHDGLPDLVEGFDHEWPTPGGPTYGVNLEERPETRKMHAYFNHSTDTGFRLDHACMDGGALGGDGVASLNHGETRGFAAPDSGFTVARGAGDFPLGWAITVPVYECSQPNPNPSPLEPRCLAGLYRPGYRYRGEVIALPTTATPEFCDSGA